MLRPQNCIEALGVPSGRITEVLDGKRAITPDTTIRLGEFFGNAPQFWLNLQTKYDLAATDLERGAKISAQVNSCVYLINEKYGMFYSTS